jgi:hypothetical protein
MRHRGPAPSAARNLPAAVQQVGGGADRGPGGDRRVPGREPVEQCLRAPQRVVVARVADQGRDGFGDPVRAVVRRAAPVGQPGLPARVIAGEPLVAGLAADGVARAELRHGEVRAPDIGDELRSLRHGVGLQPRHRNPLKARDVV